MYIYLCSHKYIHITFTCSRFEELAALPPDFADLVWIQWTLQVRPACSSLLRYSRA